MFYYSRRFSISLTVLFMVLFGAAVAYGADQKKSGRGKGHVLPTVKVTADKRVSDVQKTPITIDVITAEEIEDAGIKSIEDVFKRIPNMVTASYPGGITYMTYRGAQSSAGTETNPIVLYVDDVPMETFQTLDANLLDIERIEILKGAQGVVYGKNAYAGVIRIITKKPGNEFAGKLFSGVDSRGGYEAGGTVGGPIVEDKLFYSLTASHNYDRGFIKGSDDAKRSELWNNRIKGQLRLTPVDDSEVAFHFDYARNLANRSQFNTSQGVFTQSIASPQDYEKITVLNLGLTGATKFENFTLESVTTGRIEKNKWLMSNTFLHPIRGDGGRDMDRNDVTQEFRIRSNDDSEGVRWLFGLYGSYSDYRMDAFEVFNAPTNATGYAPFRLFTGEFAPFGQLEIPITDSLKLTTGLRWHYVRRNGSVKYTLGPSSKSAHVEAHWKEFLPRINLSYDIDDSKMVYAGVSRSFIPGGICYYSTTGAGDLKYESQKAWNYEVGAKTEWLDNRLRINPVLFYTMYEDLQEMAYDSGTGNFLASNPGEKATAYGAEVDVTYLITPGLEADASLGYTMAKYNKYESKTQGSLDGNRVMMSPKYTARAGLQYRHDNGLFLRGDVNYIGEFYWEANNKATRSPVTTVDARVGWEFDSFDIYAFGRNIFGARYLDFRSSFISRMAETETFGIEMTYRF